MADDMELKLRIEAVLKGFEELGKAAQQVTNLGEAARGKASPGLEGMLNQMDPLAGKTAEAGKEFQRLMDKLDPLQAHANAFAKDLETLNAAYKDGAMTQAEYAKRVDDLDRYYQSLEPKARAAAAAIQGVQESAQTASVAFSGLQEMTATLVRGFLALLAFQKIKGLLSDVADEALKVERQGNQVAFVLNATGQAATEGVEALEAYSEKMVALGQNQDATRESVLRLLPVAGSMENAIKAQKLALDIATATGRDYSTVLGGIERLMNGSLFPINSVRGGLYGLGVDADTASGALQGLAGKFSGATEKMDDNTRAVAAMKAEWAGFKQHAGEGILLFLHDAAEKTREWRDEIQNLNPVLKAMIASATGLDMGPGGWFSTPVNALEEKSRSDFATAQKYRLEELAEKTKALVAEQHKYQEEQEYVGPGVAFQDLQKKIDESKAKLQALHAEMQRVLSAKSVAEIEGGAPSLGVEGQQAEIASAYSKELRSSNLTTARLKEMKAEVEALMSKVSEGTESWSKYNDVLTKITEALDKRANKALAETKKQAEAVKTALRDMGFNDKGEIKLPYRPGLGDLTEEDAYLKKLTERLFQEGEAAKNAKEADEKWMQGLVAAQSPLARLQEGLQRLNKARQEGADAALIEAAQDALYAKYGEEMNALIKKNDQMSELIAAAWKHAGEEIQHSLEEFLFNPFKEGLRGMLSGFIEVIHRILSELLAARLWQMFSQTSFWGSLVGLAGGMATGGAASVGSSGGVGIGNLSMGMHTGGLVGDNGTPHSASILAFLGAPRLHAGALLGLQSDEVPTILQRGEEVLSKNDPRNALNGGASGSVRVLNIIDPNLVHDYLQSSAGEKVVVNHISRNAGTIKQILARA